MKNDPTAPGLMMQAFDFEECAVRVMVRDDEPWFVAADVCRVLEIANARDAAGSLDEDEKGVVNADTPGGRQQMKVISESGLYALVFKSRKPEAKRFRKWITAEVIPALRKTGRYEVPAGAGAAEGQSDVISLLAFVRGACEGWSLERKMEFGLKARRFAKSMGVVFQVLQEPGVGRCFGFPRVILEEVRRAFHHGCVLPDSNAQEFERLIEDLHLTYGEAELSPDRVRAQAKRKGLFPQVFVKGVSRQSEWSRFGKLVMRFDNVPFPNGLQLQVTGPPQRRRYVIRRGETMVMSA